MGLAEAVDYKISKSIEAASEKVALLVPSCDKYSDLWNIFFQFFNLYWPDCPYKIYLLTNHLDFQANKVTTLKVGDDISWSDSLSTALGMIKEDYVFLFLEDLFLTKHVDTASILAIVNWAIESGANYIRLNPYPRPDVNINNETIGLISFGAIYRTSTVISIWKKSVLIELLMPGESAWQFEIEGTKRSDKYEKFYSAYSVHVRVVNAVIKSKWCKEAIMHMKKHGIRPESNLRMQMTFVEEVGYFIRKQRSRFFRILPNKYRRYVKTFAARIG